MYGAYNKFLCIFKMDVHRNTNYYVIYQYIYVYAFQSVFFCYMHGVEHLVAILFLVSVQKTDDRRLSVIFILCVHITKFKIDCVYFQNSMYTKTLLF